MITLIKRKRPAPIWTPMSIINELESIKVEKQINGGRSNSEAFRVLHERYKVGREFEIMRDRFFLQDIFNKKKKK